MLRDFAGATVQATMCVFNTFLDHPCPGAGASLFCLPYPAPRSKLQKWLASLQKKLWSTWKLTMTRYENWGAGAPRDTEALSRPFCRRLPPIRKTRSLAALSQTAWTKKKVEQLSTVPLIFVLLILLLHVPGQGQACRSNVNMPVSACTFQNPESILSTAGIMDSVLLDLLSGWRKGHLNVKAQD